jgi:hypothetical protein
MLHGNTRWTLGAFYFVIRRPKLENHASEGLTHLYTPWSRVLLEKLTGFKLVKHFMEPESSFPHSQVPATCPYPEPARSSAYPPHPTSR